MIALIALGACAFVYHEALPLLRHAESEFGLPLHDQGIIRTQAAANHLPPALVAAVIDAETKFDARTSPAGAEGLMQIEPQTAEYLAHLSGGVTFKVADLWQPQVNIAYGAYYLRYLLNEFGGRQWLALAAYNAGETNVDQWMAAARASHRPLTVATIPFPETRAYVEHVLAAEKDYRATYPRQLGYP